LTGALAGIEQGAQPAEVAELLRDLMRARDEGAAVVTAAATGN